MSKEMEFTPEEKKAHYFTCQIWIFQAQRYIANRSYNMYVHFGVFITDSPIFWVLKTDFFFLILSDCLKIIKQK